MVLLCIKIFCARILDVSIGTFRTLVMVRGHKIFCSILAFFEVFVWFYAARSALSTEINGILIPVVYSLGYATGSYIGMLLSEKLIKGTIGVNIITDSSNIKIIDEIKNNDFGVTELKLVDDNKIMLIIQTSSLKFELLNNIIKKYDEKAFITFNETKYIKNGWVK